MVKIKVLLISSDSSFIKYVHHLITNHENTHFFNVVLHIDQAIQLQREYIHDLIIWDFDDCSYFTEGLNFIEDTREVSLNQTQIMVFESNPTIENCRTLLRAGVYNYYNKNELSKDIIKEYIMKNNNRFGLKSDLTKEQELEYYLGLVRDEQRFPAERLEFLIRELFKDTIKGKYVFCFFRIDDITYHYHSKVTKRNIIRKKLEETIKQSIFSECKLVFTKNHSGIIIIDNEIDSSALLEEWSQIIKSFQNKTQFKITVILDEGIQIKDFSHCYIRCLKVINNKFYEDNGRVVDKRGLSISELNHLDTKHLSFGEDIKYHYRRRDFINVEFFLRKTLDYMKKNLIAKQDVIDYFLSLYFEIKLELFASRPEIINIDEKLRWITYFDNFENFKKYIIWFSSYFEDEIIKYDHNFENIHIYQIKKIIKKELENDLSLKKMSKDLGLSKVYISKLFKNETGINLSVYIKEQRIKRAKSILKDSDCRISDVAIKVGYNDPMYFSRVFKEMVGVSPTEYRAVRKVS